LSHISFSKLENDLKCCKLLSSVMNCCKLLWTVLKCDKLHGFLLTQTVQGTHDTYNSLWHLRHLIHFSRLHKVQNICQQFFPHFEKLLEGKFNENIESIKMLANLSLSDHHVFYPFLKQNRVNYWIFPTMMASSYEDRCVKNTSFFGFSSPENILG